MGILVSLTVGVFVVVCLLLVVIILLQDSKGEGLSSSAFGGDSLQSVLGGAGATTFLSRATKWLAVAFMVISLFLMRFYGESKNQILTSPDQPQEQSQTELINAQEDQTDDQAKVDQAENTESEE